MGSASSCIQSLPPLRDFFHPTLDAYMVTLNIFQYFPLVSVIQWLTAFHPAGKTSLKRSYLNFPGRLGWFIMEIVGPVNLLYILWTLPPTLNITSLPYPNKLAASLYIIHYINRAIISPFFAAPSMSPIHAFVVFSAVLFNWLNSTCLAGWIVGYQIPIAIPSYTSTSHPVTMDPSPSSSTLLPSLGMCLFLLGMAGNIHAERTLFRLRREEAETRHSKKSSSAQPNGTSSQDSSNKFSKVYVIPPPTGLFRSILYPHYVCEWLEWLGFALVGTAVLPVPSALGGVAAASSSSSLVLAPWVVPFALGAERLRLGLPLPAVLFFVNAVANMLPHARWGRKWYVERFGAQRVAGRGAVVPFCGWL
ncbi:3-oxo-5-alpha-steroid 4-dehydrogenase family protein [Aspergillus steynii IBT 23096]|uniref:3-oxo-5-alpha-steroid 4-dehydrogenase family protein n=1 Tax=Aspergillus steynii IBT 23096 TaxID=1392250 RepID=A0A2I2GNJ1_9EURO|nr:3-oxo-5-alpha-steroid 4-dehydrogenase family protein [Aspergillus steynii IBT 23096]PLB54452.1 3-oxo-5-alpha-steroid 4-dehydrogenase family protein [Aspergillus steynii IBT 23096]